MPTIYIMMSKRCAIGYAACDGCVEKKRAAGDINILPDPPFTLEAMQRLKKLNKWPPICAFCGGSVGYRIELNDEKPAEEQVERFLQDNLL